MSPRPALEAVICDAGGTLIRLDFEWIAGDLLSQGLATDGARLRRAEVEGRRAYDASACPATPSSPVLRGDVRAYFGGMLTAAGLAEPLRSHAIDRLLAREQARGLWCRPMEGARAALDALRSMGLRIAVVSNSDGRAERHLENAGMMDGLEFVVDSHLVGIEKPDPAIFSVALGRLGSLPERTLFVGDIRSVDEAGARAAGMRFVLLDPFGDYGDAQTSRIAGMHELAAWVESGFEVVPATASRPGPGKPAGAARRSG